MNVLVTMVRFVSAAALATAVFAQAPAAPAPAYTKVAVYPLATCVVSGKALTDDAVSFTAAGRTFRTCSEECRATVTRDPAPFVAKLDAAVIEQQLPTYPLERCPITGLVLGSMGAPVKVVFDGTLVQLCCRACFELAKAKSAEIVARIHDEAFAQQQKAYPLADCAVSGEPLAKSQKPVDLLVGTALVRVADQQGASEVGKQPAKYLAKVLALRPAVAKAPVVAATGGCGMSCGGCSAAMDHCDDKAKTGEPQKAKVEEKAKGCGGCNAVGTKAETKPEPKPAGKTEGKQGN